MCGCIWGWEVLTRGIHQVSPAGPGATTDVNQILSLVREVTAEGGRESGGRGLIVVEEGCREQGGAVAVEAVR